MVSILVEVCNNPTKILQVIPPSLPFFFLQKRTTLQWPKCLNCVFQEELEFSRLHNPLDAQHSKQGNRMYYGTTQMMQYCGTSKVHTLVNWKHYKELDQRAGVSCPQV